MIPRRILQQTATREGFIGPLPFRPPVGHLAGVGVCGLGVTFWLVWACVGTGFLSWVFLRVAAGCVSFGCAWAGRVVLFCVWTGCAWTGCAWALCFFWLGARWARCVCGIVVCALGVRGRVSGSGLVVISLGVLGLGVCRLVVCGEGVSYVLCFFHLFYVYHFSFCLKLLVLLTFLDDL